VESLYTVRVQSDRFTTWLQFTAFATILIVSGFGLPGVAHAEQEDNDRDAADIRLLAKRFANAISHKSVSEQKAILHPSSRACIRSENQSYFDGIFSRRLGYVIPSDYVLKSEVRSPEFFSPPEAIANYPVLPTRILQIDFYTAPMSHMTILLSIAKKGSSWYEVLPCPSTEDMKRMLAMEAEKKAWDKRVQQLVSSLTDPLRSDIENLVANGRRTEAVRKYQEATGEDLAFATAVVDAFSPKR
jgi:hypothetical protein